MIPSLAASTYPVAASPYNLVRYLFFVDMLLGVSWFHILKARAPPALLGIEHDLEVSVAKGTR
jgi:hypothetical protein